MAVATYERTMTFTQSPWRSYVKGNMAALSDSQKRGAQLFFETSANGGANCASCHKGDFFTDEGHYVLAVPQIGRGKSDANSPTDNNDDWGRAHVTGIDTDKYAFRVPTLLNVEMTGPFGHTGVFETLEAVIRHHTSARKSVESFKAMVDSGTLANRLRTLYGPAIDLTRSKEHTEFALARLEAQRQAGQDVLKDVALTDAQVLDLVEFMKALTDPCAKDKACLAKWVPRNTDKLLGGATATSLNLICPKDKDGAALISAQLCQP
jgi:cytochrome c peroxidase